VLRARLPHLARATARRRDLAGRYRRRLPRSIETIRERDPGHVYHLFPVRSSRRDALQASLASSRIETLIHYPVSLTDQPAFAPYAPLPCPVATEAARTLLSLPLTARLTDADVDRVASVVAEFEKGHVPA